MTAPESREAIVDRLRMAFKRGEFPSAPRADLRGAYLRGANLSRADLSGANLRGADMWDTDLRSADLLGADLLGADLLGADLSGADMTGTDLGGANLRGATGGILTIPCGIPSGQALLFPTPIGWSLQIGCWTGTPTSLRELIAADDDWPEARGQEVLRRRPLLEALCTLADAHIAYHADAVPALAAKWGTS